MKSKLYRIFNEMDDISYHLRRYLNNCIGHDYNHQTIDQVVADERRISELSIAFAQALAMIIQDMDHQKWDLFWANLGNYIFEEDD